MRILYLILKITLNYSLRIFYPRMAFHNSPKSLLGRTIYVSNHAASFMDPISIASLRRPIIFFLTRSDVFTPISKPFLWACHMLPIYRQHDGDDTRGKNEEVFKKCASILKWGRNLLIFGEGFTDDQFIRRLKPVKKGAIKIGFTSLELLNWEKNIYVCAMGVNYSNPNQMRSDFLISYSNRICLNDYRKDYEENPNKVVTELTRLLEKEMREQITHIEDKDLAPFHEQIMIFTRRGTHYESFDKKRKLKERWRYSQRLANWINSTDLSDEDTPINLLRKDMSTYFALLKRMKLSDEMVFWKARNGTRWYELLMLVVLAPFALLGIVHTLIPYLLIKRFVEKSFKRKVFWGSVKLVAGMITIGLLNIPVIFIFYHLIYPSYWLGFLYYSSIGLTGLAAYMWFVNFRRYRIKGLVRKTDLSKLIPRREQIIQEMKEILPAEFH